MRWLWRRYPDRAALVDQLSVLAERFCLAEDRVGFLCTKRPNHPGDHVATSVRPDVFGCLRVYNRWPQRDLAQMQMQEGSRGSGSGIH